MANVVKFINWSNEDFTWKWGGEALTVKSRDAVWMQDWKAEHFAKHLTDRELNKKNLPTDHFTRGEYVQKCISEGSVEASSVSDDAVETELLNKNAQAEPLKVKKPGRPKKEEAINPEFTE